METKRKKAIDITPYNHLIVCTFKDRPGHAIAIEIHKRCWSQTDPQKIVFQLETHNVILADSWEELEVCERPDEVVSQQLLQAILAKDAELMKKPPKVGPACQGRGEIKCLPDPSEPIERLVREVANGRLQEHEIKLVTALGGVLALCVDANRCVEATP